MYEYGKVPAELEPQSEIFCIDTGELVFTGNLFDANKKIVELNEGFSYNRRKELNLPLYAQRNTRPRFALSGRLGYAEAEIPVLMYLRYGFNTIEQVFDFMRENKLRPCGVRVNEYDLEAGPHDMNGMYAIPMVWRLKTSYTAQAWRKEEFNPAKLYLAAGEMPEQFPRKGSDVKLRTTA